MALNRKNYCYYALQNIQKYGIKTISALKWRRLSSSLLSVMPNSSLLLLKTHFLLSSCKWLFGTLYLRKGAMKVSLRKGAIPQVKISACVIKMLMSIPVLIITMLLRLDHLINNPPPLILVALYK